MEDLDYFVMLYVQKGKPVIMTEVDSEEPAYFASVKEARKAGKGNLLGDMFGYEVFCLGLGE